MYDNSSSGLATTTVQEAIDKVQENTVANLSSINVITNLLKYYSNRNILDNWYFQNPINQLNKATYNTAGICIDRWNLSAGATVNLIGNSHLNLHFSEANYSYLQQLIPNPIYYRGIQLTLSAWIKCSQGRIAMTVGDRNKQFGITHIDPSTEWKLIKTTFIVPNDAIDLIVNFINQNVVSDVDIAYVKLETGGVQTLMHYEGPNIVLTDPIPNTADMLIRCARYMQVIGNINRPNIVMDMGTYYKYYDAQEDKYVISLNIPLITSLSKFPDVVTVTGFRCLGAGPNNTVVGNTFLQSELLPLLYVEGFQNVINIALPVSNIEKFNTLAPQGQIDTDLQPNAHILIYSGIES